MVINMTSLILIWRKDDKSDIKIVRDEGGRPLLFEFKGMASRHASEYYGPGSEKAINDLYNYKVIELK